MKVLNFGSLNIDYVYSVDHFVTAGETLSSHGFTTNAGGKGLNQSIALAKAGSSVYHAGMVGLEGGFLLRLLQENGVNISLVQETSSATGHTIIQVDKTGQNCILLYGGANQNIDAAFADTVLSHFEPGDMLLLQNEISSLGHIMQKAAENKMTIVLNPSPITDSLQTLPLELVSMFLINEIEGAALAGSTDPDTIVKALLKKYPQSRIVLTLGAAGAIYADAETVLFQPIFPANTVDTTAAGDTFTGYLLDSISKGFSVEKALRRASFASSLAVSRQGAAASIPYAAEVDAGPV